MRKAFVDALLKHATPETVFLTADLGYNCVEPIQAALGPRFLNAGVAEQNMIGAAAGLALAGMSPWCYSIAPFLYARCFEQIRNDLCWHELPVKLVGNGGGYGYGVMGASHHAIDDYGALLTMPNLRVFVPAFDADVEPCVQAMLAHPGPSYLRLGVAEASVDQPYAPWRLLIKGDSWNPVIVATGPIAGGLLRGILDEYGPPSPKLKTMPSLWVCTEPGSDPPPEFYGSLYGGPRLVIVEEHVVQGSLGQRLLYDFQRQNFSLRRVKHLCAQGHSDREGSQAWHRQQSGLDVESIMKELR